MKSSKFKHLILSITFILSSGVIYHSHASDTDGAVKSLDMITSQASDIPSLLMDKPISLPEPQIAPSESKLSAPAKKTARYRLQTSQAQTDVINHQIAELKASQAQQIAELTKQNAAAQDESNKALAEQQQKTAEVQKQLSEMTAKLQSASQDGKIAELRKQYTTALDVNAKALEAQKQKVEESAKLLEDLQMKWQNATQQLDAANKRVAELNASRLDDGQVALQLKQSVADSQSTNAELTKKIVALTAAQESTEEELATAKKMLTENTQKSAVIESKWKDATTKLDSQTKQLASLQSVQETPAPATKEDIRAYALGAFWGHDVLSAMKKVETDGFKLSQPQVVSGVTDMMRGKFKIPQEKMLAELKEMDESVSEKPKATAASDDSGKTFIAQYSKKSGVKRSSMGYYYRILEKGTGSIKNTDTVAIAVTESLTNGEVIKDMIKAGKVLVLPYDRFPPLFKTALSQLKNKGKMQLVVPPELAYGEAGSPPKIPPNATMVYDLQVVDVTKG